MNMCQEKLKKILQPVQSRNQRAIHFYAVGDIEMRLQKLVYPEGDNHIPLEFNKFSFLHIRIICNTISFLHVNFVLTEL